MKILHMQQIILTFQYPLFLINSLALRAVAIATGVIMDLDMPTGRAVCHMTTQYMSPALADIPDEFLLFKAQDTMFLIVIGKAV